MSKSSIDQTTREERGLALYHERGQEIIARGACRYEVPSGTKQGQRHFVDLELECCSCRDHQRSGHTCKHIYAATIAASKPRKTIKRERFMFTPEQVMRNVEALEAMGA